ncbi:MAG: polysulfide reductase NrfD [Porticoccaceae bacterium]|nr:polysulfide reductase NrfD [Porticoccaceae bacterium]
MSFSSVAVPHQSMGAMVPEFATSRTRFVEHMGFLEVLSFFGEGVGAGLYILGVLTNQPLAMLLGVVFVAIAVVALVAHLGSRAHLAWRAITKFRTSWVSRGSLFISLFMAFSVSALLASQIAMFAWLEKPLTILAFIFAPLVIIYAGMMLRSMKAVTLWRSYYLPVGFSAHSAASALIVFWCYGQFAGLNQDIMSWLQPATVFCLLLSAAIAVLHLVRIPRSAGIEASLERLLRGKLRTRLIWGAGGLGILVPLALAFLGWLAVAQLGQSLVTILLAVAALCRLFGDYAYRSAFVMAGAYEPIIPPPSRNLGK